MSNKLRTKLEYTDDTKQLIKSALQAKGQAVTDQDTFRSYVEKIVNITDVVAEDLTVNPSTTIQEFEPTGQYNAYSKVTVNPVTANIDANIRPENIREGVTILGVTGTMSEREDLNIELTALENQVTTLQTALDSKTSSEMTQSDVDEAKNQIADLFGENNE